MRSLRDMLVLLVAACGAPKSPPLVSHDVSPPPLARIHIEKTEQHAMTVFDPYRWMEQTETREFQEWVSRQNSYTRSILDKLPIHKELHDQLRSLSDSRDEVHDFSTRATKQFYLKRPVAADTFKLYVRDRDSASERVLVDPVSIARSATASIDFYEPSSDGSYVAFGVATKGSEDATIYVVDVQTATLLPDAIDRARHGEPRWLPDGKSFFYRRNPKTAAVQGPERYQRSRDYLHVLGREPDQDPPVFGYQVSESVVLDPSDSPYVYAWPGCPYVFGLVQHGTKNELTIYFSALSSVNGPATPWKKLADVDDEVVDLAVHDRDVFLLTHRDAPRSKIIRTRLDAPDLTRADTVIAPSEAVVAELVSAKDALYVRLVAGGVGRLVRVPFNTSVPQSLQPPVSGTVGSLTATLTTPGVAFRLQSWTRPDIFYAYQPSDRRFDTLDILPTAASQGPELEAIEVVAKSEDGTAIPLSIMYKRGLDRSRRHPTLLSGYGNYGISLNPRFEPRRLAWLERGGIYAVAHVRGGGEYGEAWHVAGMQANKHNSVEDFIACARLLIDDGYTSSQQLAAEGTSAGGLTVGGAVIERPEMFGAALLRVAIVDALRFEITPLGPQNTAEFGSSATPDGFKSLYAMSPYYHISDRSHYPAILLTASAHDARVPVWQPAKMAARLQAASASKKPILFRLETDAGHGYGLGTTNPQLNDELADIYAFLFWQLSGSSTSEIVSR